MAWFEFLIIYFLHRDIGIILLCNIVSVFIVYRRILRHLGKASKRKVSIVLIAMMRHKSINHFIIPNGTYIHNLVQKFKVVEGFISMITSIGETFHNLLSSSMSHLQLKWQPNWWDLKWGKKSTKYMPFSCWIEIKFLIRNP